MAETVCCQIVFILHIHIPWAAALVQWLKLPAWKVGDRGLEPRSGIQVSKKKMYFLQLPHF